jgi:hypothetical protein
MVRSCREQSASRHTIVSRTIERPGAPGVPAPLMPVRSLGLDGQAFLVLPFYLCCPANAAPSKQHTFHDTPAAAAGSSSLRFCDEPPPPSSAEVSLTVEASRPHRAEDASGPSLHVAPRRGTLRCTLAHRAGARWTHAACDIGPEHTPW